MENTASPKKTRKWNSVTLWEYEDGSTVDNQVAYWMPYSIVPLDIELGAAL